MKHMKIFFVLELFALFCLCLSCSVLYAEEVYHVEENAVVNDDLVIIGKSCVVEGTVNGDAVIINGDIDLYGTVNGDAVILGGNIGLYTGSRIKGDMVIIGGKYIKEKGAGDIVAGDVVTIPFGGLNHLFKLIPDVQVSTEEQGVELRDWEELIEGKMEEAEETIENVIEGKIEPKLRGMDDIEGKIREKRDKIKTLGRPAKLARRGNVMKPVWTLIWGISMSIVAMIFTAVFPSSAEKMTLYLEERPGRSFLTGFLAQILFVPAILFLVLSILGIPLIPLFIFLYPLAWLVGLVPSSLFTGKRITKDSSFFENKTYLVSFVGIFVLFVLFFIAKLLQIGNSVLAVLGTSIHFIALFILYLYFTFGLGSLILSKLGTKRP